MNSSWKKFLFSAFLSLVGLCFPDSLHAQFIGYFSPQTVQATLANNVACTGVPQIYKTGSVPKFNNLGQTQHYASVVYTGSPSGPNTVEIDGIDNQGNVFRLSDVGITTAGNSALISGSGYYPQIQIQVECSSGTTFTLNYSGASSTFNQNVGAYQLSQLDKSLFAGVSSGTQQIANFQTPYASAQGVILFQYIGSGATSVITVTCSGLLFSPSSPYDTVQFQTANATTLQVFQVPAFACPNIQLETSVSGSTTFSAEYIFTAPGQPATADPCSSGFPKLSDNVNIASATTTQIGAGVSGSTRVYVCGFNLIATGTTPTYVFESGTGSTCAGGTIALTGTYQPAVGQPNSYGGAGTIFAAQPGLNICLVTGGTPSVQGVVTYVDQ
jgi:hypothetical protein